MEPSKPESPNRRFLVIGDSPVCNRVQASLIDSNHLVTRLHGPSDEELERALSLGQCGVAILFHDDVAALRYAMATAHLDGLVPIVVTIFDQTIGAELQRLIPTVEVTSPAMIGVPILLGPCIRPGSLAARRRGSKWVTQSISPTHSVLDLPVPSPRRWQLITRKVSMTRWDVLDSGAKMLIVGGTGLLSALAFETSWNHFVHGTPLARAFYEGAHVVATVGSPESDSHQAYLAFAGLLSLATLGFAAMFTAGMVERVVGNRLAAILGRRSVPRRNHVIVVGLGQVGYRLCRDLKELGIPVVGVERDGSAANLRFAKAEKIPVVIGHGADRNLLRSLRLTNARAIAAVGSDDLDNIAVAVATHAIDGYANVVMRAGEQEAVAETRSLLPLGVTRDVMAATSIYVCAALEGSHPSDVLPLGDGFGVWNTTGKLVAESPQTQSRDSVRDRHLILPPAQAFVARPRTAQQ